MLRDRNKCASQIKTTPFILDWPQKLYSSSPDNTNLVAAFGEDRKKPLGVIAPRAPYFVFRLWWIRSNPHARLALYECASHRKSVHWFSIGCYTHRSFTKCFKILRKEISMRLTFVSQYRTNLRAAQPTYSRRPLRTKGRTCPSSLMRTRNGAELASSTILEFGERRVSLSCVFQVTPCSRFTCHCREQWRYSSNRDSPNRSPLRKTCYLFIL